MIKELKPLCIGDIEIKVPIIQGAMGVKISTAPLVAAVANYGGAGTIASVGLAYGTKEKNIDYIKISAESMKSEIKKTRELTDGVFGVNVLFALSHYDELVRAAAEEKVDFIVSGAGLPLKLPELVENTSTKIIPIVSSDRAANIILKTWKRRYNRFPDAIIIEGPFAGGHIGFSEAELENAYETQLEDIVVDVLKIVREYETDYKISIPVIAAGGIFDGKDIARFLNLGAQGVQMATRFVATDECAVTSKFKELYIKASIDDVHIIKSPVGMPGRVIKTDFIDKIQSSPQRFICDYQCLKTCNPKTSPYCIAKALCNALDADFDNAVVFAGRNVYKIKEIIPVNVLMDSLVKDTIQELNSN
ncbi:MAG: nitronate monooxygenase [Candidatus Auribacter fodinae]|jgi:NAD(P)H-dependent flavin oxidoreductase YrpB (nitropropane dioxygenase family)|uniref:Nitronate monooxygenase n=1 Tax=Candidatus Auribacter fodinae TaxID=2093366 RepID=A0A3A4QSW6_9BACT|nr:MAG: nitronate monooxygenase [Candidatus Auribacter fodinae]